MNRIIILMFLFNNLVFICLSNTMKSVLIVNDTLKNNRNVIPLGQNKYGNNFYFISKPSSSNYLNDFEVLCRNRKTKKDTILWNGSGTIDTVEMCLKNTCVYYTAFGGGFDNSYQIRIKRGKLSVTKIRENGFPIAILDQLKKEGVDYYFSMDNEVKILNFAGIEQIHIDTFLNQSKYYFLLNEDTHGLPMVNPNLPWYQYVVQCDAKMVRCKVLGKFSPREKLVFKLNSKYSTPLLLYNKNGINKIYEYRKGNYREKIE